MKTVLSPLLVKEGRTGGVPDTVHGPKRKRITDQGYQNFIFPNHENKQITYFFSALTQRKVAKKDCLKKTKA